MNIFKAVEIYKRIPGVPSNQNPLRVIRGLWVSGTHLDTITIDATLHVTGETSNHCEERAYTDSRVDGYLEGNVNIIDFQSTDFTVQQYTTQRASSYLEGNVNVIEFNSSAFTIYGYGNAHVDGYIDGNVNVIEMADSDFTIADYIVPKQYVSLPEKTGQNPAEPTLLIKVFTSNQLEWQ